MIRLRNIQTGAIVSVTAEKAARLGSEWAPIPTAESKPAPTGRRAKTK